MMVMLAFALLGCAETDPVAGAWVQEGTSGTYDPIGDALVACNQWEILLELGDGGDYVRTETVVQVSDDPVCGDPGTSVTYLESGAWTWFTLGADSTAQLSLARDLRRTRWEEDGEVVSEREDLDTWEEWHRVDGGGEDPRWLWIEGWGRLEEASP